MSQAERRSGDEDEEDVGDDDDDGGNGDQGDYDYGGDKQGEPGGEAKGCGDEED